jgi:hypothetical protein
LVLLIDPAEVNIFFQNFFILIWYI